MSLLYFQHRLWIYTGALVFWFSVGTAFSAAMVQDLTFSGRTMGTTCFIKAQVSATVSSQTLQKEIDACLEKINVQMSTFLPDSEISRFNRMPAGTMPVSPDFYAVMKASEDLYKITHGAWDGTMYPILQLWGFFIKGKTPDVPTDTAISQALQNVGFHFIEIGPPHQLIKKKKDVQVDLASIAKGYGVDQLLQVLKQHGVQNGFVEIGGEVAAMGTRPDQKPWQVGITYPSSKSHATEVVKTIPIYNKAVATSGTYQNYFEKDGKRYSHIIDPRTGRPVTPRIVSVTVIAPTCTQADGLATALLVMGVKKGMALVKQLPNISCLILEETAPGVLKAHRTASFPK